MAEDLGGGDYHRKHHGNRQAQDSRTCEEAHDATREHVGRSHVADLRNTWCPGLHLDANLSLPFAPLLGLLGQGQGQSHSHLTYSKAL